MIESGRLSRDEVLDVLAAARTVAGEISSGARWWSEWDGWTPADGIG